MPSALITLTTAGTGTGPFDLYSNVNGYSTPFETNVLKNLLVAGYTSTSVLAGTTIIRVQSTSVGCPNYVDISVVGITTSTTTTSTTAAPTNSRIVNNTGVTISGTFVVSVKIGSGSFNTVYSNTMSIAPGATFNFNQFYYPGLFSYSGNTFKLDVYSASGLTAFDYIQMFVGSTSTAGNFTLGSPTTAQTYSAGDQFQVYIGIYD